MNELIPFTFPATGGQPIPTIEVIIDGQPKPMFDARWLHAELGVKTELGSWQTPYFRKRLRRKHRLYRDQK